MANRWLGTRALFALAGVGALAGLAGALVSGHRQAPVAPVFDPAPNPYAQGIFANGMVESDLPDGSNLSLYPEVAGTVAAVLVQEGQAVHRGTPLLRLDPRVARAAAEQARAQADAAQALLQQMQAQPRPEALQVARAQRAAAAAAVQAARDSYDKLQHAYELDADAVSRDSLDGARDAWQVAQANLATAERQLELTAAGTWSYDLASQAATVRALERSYEAAAALLDKYTLRAAGDGVVLAIRAGVGSYVTQQGVYDPYTQSSNNPPLVLGSPPQQLNVRCYVDEILIPRLPPAAEMKARMVVRGGGATVPLRFARIEPLVTPKIDLSDQRQERVDVRVLPVLFHLDPGAARGIYPGQMVDVYIGR